MTATIHTLPIARSMVYVWAYRLKRITETHGELEASRYAESDIPQQFIRQVGALIDEAYKYEKN